METATQLQQPGGRGDEHGVLAAHGNEPGPPGPPRAAHSKGASATLAPKADKGLGLLSGATRLLGAWAGPRGLGPEADLIRAYWKGVVEPVLPPVPPLAGTVLSSLCVGLGDTLMLTDLPRASKGMLPVYSASQHFRPLMKHNHWWFEPPVERQLMLVNAPTLVRHYASGNGHYLQRIRRAFGLPVEAVPRGCVEWKGRRFDKRVVMHFDPGAHVLWQRKFVHPRARALYHESRAVLEHFVASRPDLEFWMVGRAPERTPLRGVRSVQTLGLAELIQVVGSCGWFIGIMSGVMHLATAMQLRCIVLLNFPPAAQVVLPTLRHTGQIESEWTYPQNVHLHQEEGSKLVPRLTLESLKRAFDGGVYPYWRTDWCRMIEEEL